jgi:hypothetical protein
MSIMGDSGRRLLSRRRATIEMAALAFAAAPMIRGVCRADTSSAATRIEEDWTLVIGTPNTVNHSPGVKMIMSTQGDLLGYSADYTINYHKEGDPAAFTAGGYGIELCSPNQTDPVITAGPSKDLLNTKGETLTWTQRLDLSNGKLTFSLWNGTSTTWGTNSGQILSVSAACTLTDLSNYDPTFSVAQSGPIWWPNRVTSLTLTEVRYYGANGNLINTDSTDRPAFP